MQGKSRILLFTTSFRPLVGGSEIAIEEIARRLPNIQFDIVTSHEATTAPVQETIGNMHVYRAGGAWGRQSFLLPKNFLPLALFFQGWKLMRRHQYHAIHAYQASQAAGAAWLLGLFYRRLVFMVTIQEGKDFSKQGILTNFFRSIILKRADVITAISNYLSDQSRRINSRAKVVLIPNGIDPELFRHVDVSGMKQNLGIADDFVVMTVSRLVLKNGVADLIEAFKAFSDKLKVNNCKLLIVGSGPLEDKLRHQAESLEGRVLFLGTVEHHKLPEYLSVADVFVRPSLSEGLGIAFLEAMACGVPVVGTNVGGIPDIIKDGETGLLVKPRDVAGIAMAIKRLNDDEPLCTRLAQAARASVERDYTWEQAARAFELLYGV